MSNQLISIALLSFCIGSILAWSYSPYIISKQIRSRHQRMILLASDTTDNDNTNKEGENKLLQDNTNEESSFGVSYIGGDPCGSKYNDDPFDVSDNFKPGLPDNIKDRIAELAKKKAEEQKEKTGR